MNGTMQANYYNNSKFYNLIHSIGNAYWLATRHVYLDTDYAYFGIQGIEYNKINGGNLFNSNSAEEIYNACIRPVVSLKSNIKIGSGDGKSSYTAYQIIN